MAKRKESDTVVAPIAIQETIDTDIEELLEESVLIDAVSTPEDKPLEVLSSKKIIIPDKKEFLKQDKLIQGIMNDSNVFDLLDVVLSEIAEESTSLKYERIKKEAADEPTDRLSLRRSNILKMVSDVLIQKRNLAINDFINLRSPQWQLVFTQMLEKVSQTFKDLGYSTEQAELFFQKLNGNLQGFEEDVEEKLKESLSKSG